MRTTKVLVLGNDPQINTIDFDRLDPSVITLGLNRIWLKYLPNYLFFHDFHIVLELMRNPEKLAQLQASSKIFSSTWLYKKNVNMKAPSWISDVYPIPNKGQFPDSATNAIQLFSNNLSNGQPIRFYLAGISLKWQEPSHFWKELEYNSMNFAKEDWYFPRFNMMFDNFKKLKTLNYKIISVTPNSKLNKIFRYENIENLYR
jgi:hypothetical protein